MRVPAAMVALFIVPLLGLLTPQSQAAGHRRVCPGTEIPSGPERGAPMNIWGKHNMTCQRISRAIRQGSWRSRGRYAGYTFTTPGFKCRIIKNYVDTVSP